MLGLDEQALERRSLARNEPLFRQGEKVTAIYFVETGRLRLERRTFDGRTLVLGTTLSGNWLLLSSTQGQRSVFQKMHGRSSGSIPLAALSYR